MFKKPETSLPFKERNQTISRALTALYEIKLISLLYLRAFLDDTIEEFQLAANVDQMFPFDDICLKVKVKGIDNPIEVFIAVQHGEKYIIKNHLKHLFYGYQKIREQFDLCNDGLFFKGKFNETECFFVLYSNAIIENPTATRDLGNTAISVKLKDLIGTGGTDERIYMQEEHVNFLCQEVMTKQMISLAQRIAKLLKDDGNFQMLMTDENILLYHVILAQKVFKVSEIHPNGHRIATFRREFFDTEEKYLYIFKDKLIKEIQTKLKPTVQNIHVTELLSPLDFKVPIAFGNIDLMIRGNDAKIERRIDYLASQIYNLLEDYKTSDKSTIVTIDDSVPEREGLLQLNGGIAGAIGNIFVLDDNSKLIKITDKTEQLEPLAKRLYTKIKNRLPNLHEFKFNFKVKKFPKLSFDFSQYEENLAKDFLNRLVIYQNQAGANNMDNIIKNEIEDQLKFNKTESEVRFLRYCDQIQKWMMSTKVAPVLTQESNLLKVEDTLISEINAKYMREMKPYNYTFTPLAVRSLKLEKLSNTIIITDNSILTVVKVIQHLKDKVHLVLNFDNIQIDDLTALRRELKFTNRDKVLILVCDEIQTEKINALEIFTVRNGNMIIVTNQSTYLTVQKYFKADSILHDKKLSLIDLSAESQKTIFKSATVIFPGVEEEIQLDLLLQGWPKPASRSVDDVTADDATGSGFHLTGVEMD